MNERSGNATRVPGYTWIEPKFALRRLVHFRNHHGSLRIGTISRVETHYSEYGGVVGSNTNPSHFQHYHIYTIWQTGPAGRFNLHVGEENILEYADRRETS